MSEDLIASSQQGGTSLAGTGKETGSKLGCTAQKKRAKMCAMFDKSGEEST